MSNTLNFTDKVLSKNFEAIDRWITAADVNIHGLVANEGQIVEALQTITDYVERLEGRIQALENIKLVVRAPRGSKLFLLSACGLSAYAGYKYALKKVDDLMDREEQEEQHLKSRIDHPAGRKMSDPIPEPKINGQTTTAENN